MTKKLNRVLDAIAMFLSIRFLDEAEETEFRELKKRLNEIRREVNNI